MEASRDTDAQIVRYTWVFAAINKPNHAVADSFAISLRIAEVEQFSSGQRMVGGVGNMLFSTCSQTWKLERSKGFFGGLPGHVITLCGQILVSRTGDDTPALRVSIQNVPVTVQNVPVCTCITRTCVSTCARGAGIHGDVLNAHTDGGVFESTHGFLPVSSACRNTHTHTHKHTYKHTHTHHTTQHNTQHHTEKER